MAASSLKEYINAISPVTEKSWQRMQSVFTRAELKKGDFFIKDGETEKRLGFLQSGIMRAYYRNEDGVEYNKHFFVPPCFIGGYASLITGRSNQINQQALSDCIVWVADYMEFTSLYNEHRDIETTARKLAELFFVHKEQREIDIVLLDADKRYINFQKEYPQLERQIPQYHIASYLGITPTQLSRIRRKFTQG